MADNSRSNKNTDLKNNINNRVHISQYDEAEPEIEYSNLSKDIQDYIIKNCIDKLKKPYDININMFKNLAEDIKNNIEENFNGIWNVIIGTDFGSYISYDKGHVIFFNLKEIHFLIFRFGVNEAQSEKV